MVNVVKYVDQGSGVGAASGSSGCGGCNCAEDLVQIAPDLPVLADPQDTDILLAVAGGVLYQLPIGDLPGGGGGDLVQQFTTIDFNNGGNISKVVGYAQVIKNGSNVGYCYFNIALLATGFGTFDMSDKMPSPYPRSLPAAYDPDPLYSPYTFESQSYDGYTAEEIHAYLNLQFSGIWQLTEPFNSSLNGKWLHFSGVYPIAPIL